MLPYFISLDALLDTMRSLLTKRNYIALGAMSAVVALFFVMNDPVAVQKKDGQDDESPRSRELVSDAADICVQGYNGDDLTTVQPYKKPMKVSLFFQPAKKKKLIQPMSRLSFFCLSLNISPTPQKNPVSNTFIRRKLSPCTCVVSLTNSHAVRMSWPKRLPTVLST